jgi:hypothetical protein
LGHVERAEKMVDHISILFNTEGNEEAWIYERSRFYYFDGDVDYEIDPSEFDIYTYLSNDDDYISITIDLKFKDPYEGDEEYGLLGLLLNFYKSHIQMDIDFDIDGCLKDRKSALKLKKTIIDILYDFDDKTDGMFRSAIFDKYGEEVLNKLFNLSGFKLNNLYNDKGKFDYNNQTILDIKKDIKK